MADATKAKGPAATAGPDDKTKGAGAAGPDKGAGGTGAPPKPEDRENPIARIIWELLEGVGTVAVIANRDEFAQTIIDAAAKLPSPAFGIAEMTLSRASKFGIAFKALTPRFKYVPILNHLVGMIDELSIDIGRIVEEKIKSAGGSLAAAAGRPAKAGDATAAGTPSTSTAKTTAAPAGGTAADQSARIVRLAATLPQPAQDTFTFWYAGLSDEQREKFHKLVAGGSDDQALAIMKKSPAQIEDDMALLDKIADAGKGKKELSLLDLQSEVRKDKGLQKKISKLIARHPKLDVTKFWQAVRSCKEPSVRTINGFRKLMDLSDDLLLAHLGLNPDAPTPVERAKELGSKTVAERDRIDTAIETSTARGWARDFRDRMKAKVDAQKGVRP